MSKALTILDPAQRIGKLILGFVGDVPKSARRKSRHPARLAREIANTAASKAAMTAGGMALPPGPLGWLTLLPELVAVWKLQSQMVADIAAVYGKQASLTPEQMVYCLFKHAASMAVRDLVVRVGERIVVRHVPLQTLGKITQTIALRISHGVLGKGISRWVPVIGALGVGAYAYFDTGRVARTAIELFEREIDISAG